MNFNTLPAIGLCFFAFANHFGLITILKTLENNPKSDSFTCIVRSYYLPIFLYLSVIIGGYYSFEQIPNFLALRPPIEKNNDLLMAIGQAGLLIGILVSLIIRIKSNSDFISTFLFSPNLNDISTISVSSNYSKSFMNQIEDNKIIFLNMFIKFLCIIIPTTTALFISQNILKFISIGASLMCPYFIVIIPGIINNKVL